MNKKLMIKKCYEIEADHYLDEKGDNSGMSEIIDFVLDKVVTEMNKLSDIGGDIQYGDLMKVIERLKEE